MLMIWYNALNPCTTPLEKGTDMTFNSTEDRTRWLGALGAVVVFTICAVATGLVHFVGNPAGTLSPAPFFFVLSLLAALLAIRVVFSTWPVRNRSAS